MTDSTIHVPAPSFADRLVDHGVEDGIGWITATAPLYGAVNGYVHVPEGHPWRGLGYDEIDVRVNGGLTYGGGEWFGFDTLHAGDWWPGMQHDPDEGDTRWTAELVSEETRNLARQAAEAAKHPAVSADLVEFLTARLNDDERVLYLESTSPPLTRAVAEVEAKRRILELHHLVPWSRVEQVPGPIVIDDPDNGRDFCDVCETAHPCQTLRLLTLPYAAHPDYQQEWKL